MAKRNTSANVDYEAELWKIVNTPRDTLLPKLESGEIRVKNVEKLLRRVSA